ncbi:MAG: hypothetical protein ACRDPK_09935 [Carbonactinosporaceae bacterium]
MGHGRALWWLRPCEDRRLVAWPSTPTTVWAEIGHLVLRRDATRWERNVRGGLGVPEPR